jgi:hypothetical protein
LCRNRYGGDDEDADEEGTHLPLLSLPGDWPSLPETFARKNLNENPEP